MQAIGLAEKEARIAREKELGIYKEHKVGLCQGLASSGLFVWLCL